MTPLIFVSPYAPVFWLVYLWAFLPEFRIILRARKADRARGAYRYVRHPSYTAGIMMFLAIGIALGSWLSTLITFLASAGVYVYRVRVEERALAAAIGQPYVDYMKRRKRFVPFIV
jgi:protein-S-isoprenylcysteine O-methyltransferase Ste14